MTVVRALKRVLSAIKRYVRGQLADLFFEIYTFPKDEVDGGMTYEGHEGDLLIISQKDFLKNPSLELHKNTLRDLIIGDGVVSLPYRLCYEYPRLRHVYIPNSVLNMWTFGFTHCRELRSIHLSENIKYIREFMFHGCINLESINIPSGIEEIHEMAFSACRKIKKYDFSAFDHIPALLGTRVFSEIPEDTVIAVPASLYDAWISAENWSAYASHIVAV